MRTDLLMLTLRTFVTIDGGIWRRRYGRSLHFRGEFIAGDEVRREFPWGNLAPKLRAGCGCVRCRHAFLQYYGALTN